MRAVLESHLKLCDELHQLALEENRHITSNKRAPDAAMVTRKRVLFDRLTASLEALKEAIATATPADRGLGSLRDQVQQKILQVVKLDRENEQLILRHSLPVRGAHGASIAPPPPGAIAKLYSKVMR